MHKDSLHMQWILVDWHGAAGSVVQSNFREFRWGAERTLWGGWSCQSEAFGAVSDVSSSPLTLLSLTAVWFHSVTSGLSQREERDCKGTLTSWCRGQCSRSCKTLLSSPSLGFLLSLLLGEMFVSSQSLSSRECWDCFWSSDPRSECEPQISVSNISNSYRSFKRKHWDRRALARSRDPSRCDW